MLLTRSNHVTDADAKRDREVEDCEHARPDISDKQIADQSRGDRWVRGFTDPNLCDKRLWLN